MINASSPRTPHQLASPVYRCRTNKGLRPTGWKTVVMIPICLQAVILLLGDPLSMPQEKISSVVVHEARRFKKSTYIRPASVNSMGGYYTARTQRVDMLD
jgi:hypothetical protein